jgi:putative transposase
LGSTWAAAIVQSLEWFAIEPVKVTPAAEREAVAHLRTAFEVSERRACRIIGCARMSVRYRLSGRTTPNCASDADAGEPPPAIRVSAPASAGSHREPRAAFPAVREERLSVRPASALLGTRAAIVVPRAANER